MRGLLTFVLALITAAVAGAAPRSQAYTLGPGDVMDLSLFGRPDLTRVNLFVEPDGNINYLQATGIHAEGLTVDELRGKMEEALSVYYKRPRVMIAPKELHSKKYFILGKVEAAGAYPMDHPVTLVEAVAQAKGVQLGLVEDKTVELCDYAHSFVLRQGKHLPVDFDALFIRGDTRQNITLEPNDYIYMASALANNIYILGEVFHPGSQGYTSDMTVTGAIALRGGFTDNAYRDRVLVLRGSLDHPRCFVVNINRTLHGSQTDFHIQPRDVIFVNSRPWRVAEEIMDTAISAFTTSATTTWTGLSVPTFITHPIFPPLNNQ
ncbi:MAG TPA: polysaccharide biosynthesis/export family protein [Chthoniobacteraceae bacterium]|jgi:protein involved in polysaccharide export with SLBB domain|nr:polysaccharide biosynthesis/export family protein [Chthoniobacteraceae bacterium]